MKPLSKFLTAAAGTAFLTLGVAGIALPGLPTTPFLLLAAFLYSRSSPRLHRWLLESRFGRAIREYEERRTIRPRVKWGALGLLWASIGLTVALASSDVLRVILVLVALIVTVLIASLPTGTEAPSRDSSLPSE